MRQQPQTQAQELPIWFHYVIERKKGDKDLRVVGLGGLAIWVLNLLRCIRGCYDYNIPKKGKDAKRLGADEVLILKMKTA
jgi:D-arabinose 1-dehydrogenase-like Zn-dependent alcohol dehydrogenase